MNIVDIGKGLQRYGWSIGEHPAFGGVMPGAHDKGSLHYAPGGQAIDVTMQGPDMAPAYQGGVPKSWQQRTNELRWRSKQLQQAQPGVFKEVLGPGNKDHETHVHLAGDAALSEPQLQWMATGRVKDSSGKLTDVMPNFSSSVAPPPLTLPPANNNSTQTGSTSDDYLKAIVFGMQLGESQKQKLSVQDSIKLSLLSSLITPQPNSMFDYNQNPLLG